MTWKMEQVEKDGNKFAGLRCGFVELRIERPADMGNMRLCALHNPTIGCYTNPLPVCGTSSIRAPRGKGDIATFQFSTSTQLHAVAKPQSQSSKVIL